jgi:hypothetical protein
MKRRIWLAVAAGMLVGATMPGVVSAGGPATAWTRQFGTDARDLAIDVAVDGKRNVYVTGRTFGSFPGQVNQGGADVFVRKYKPNGGVAWTRQFGTSGFDSGNGIAVDRKGAIYVVGRVDSALPGQSTSGSNDAFIRKYKPGGGVAWTRQFGSAAADDALGVAIDRRNRIYVVGDTSGALPRQSNKGGADGFVRRYRTGGGVVWTRQFGTSGSDRPRGVSADRFGRIYVAGYTDGRFPRQKQRGAQDGFVRRFAPSGQTRWTRQFGTGSSDFALRVATDRRGRIYVTGYTEGRFARQKSRGFEDAFLRAFKPGGQTRWTRQFGSSSGDIGESVATDAGGAIYVTGSVNASLAGQAHKGNDDVFLRRFGPDGKVRWTRQFGTAEGESGLGVAVDDRRRIAIAGLTGGKLPGQPDPGDLDAFARVYRQ